jgi:hypothetical protein
MPVNLYAPNLFLQQQHADAACIIMISPQHASSLGPSEQPPSPLAPRLSPLATRYRYWIVLVRSCVSLQDLTPAPLYICTTGPFWSVKQKWWFS